jgi:glycine cleavage system H protein
MGCPTNLKYSTDHEWARLEGDSVVVGITEHAQDALGDVVFVELPDLEQALSAGDSLHDRPELINEDPYGEGWILKLKVSGPEALSELMSASEYDELLEG